MNEIPLLVKGKVNNTHTHAVYSLHLNAFFSKKCHMCKYTVSKCPEATETVSLTKSRQKKVEMHQSACLPLPLSARSPIHNKRESNLARDKGKSQLLLPSFVIHRKNAASRLRSHFSLLLNLDSLHTHTHKEKSHLPFYRNHHQLNSSPVILFCVLCLVSVFIPSFHSRIFTKDLPSTLYERVVVLVDVLRALNKIVFYF